jgi:hypothetical protein
MRNPRTAPFKKNLLINSIENADTKFTIHSAERLHTGKLTKRAGK